MKFCFKVTIKQFAQATIKSLRNRFSDSPLYYSMRILEPNEAPINRDRLGTYEKTEIKILTEFYGKAKRNESNTICEAVLDGSILIKEWKMVRNIICDYKDFFLLKHGIVFLIIILIFVISFLI